MIYDNNLFKLKVLLFFMKRGQYELPFQGSQLTMPWYEGVFRNYELDEQTTSEERHNTKSLFDRTNQLELFD